MLVLAHSVSNMPSFWDPLDVSVKRRENTGPALPPHDAKTACYWISRVFTHSCVFKMAFDVNLSRIYLHGNVR